MILKRIAFCEQETPYKILQGLTGQSKGAGSCCGSSQQNALRKENLWFV